VKEPTAEIIVVGTKTPPDGTHLGTVVASYYGAGFQGHRTASGETFDRNALTAAHRTLPFGALLKVTSTASGESVIVRINDRGPYVADRGIDLSEAAFNQISHLGAGVITVNLEVVNGG
jgi:rare lipoprotein A